MMFITIICLIKMQKRSKNGKAKPVQEEQDPLNRDQLWRIAQRVIKKMKDDELKMTEKEIEDAEKMFDEVDVEESQQQPQQEAPKEPITLQAQSGPSPKEVPLPKRDKENLGRIRGLLAEDIQGSNKNTIQYVIFDGTRKWNEKLENPKLGKFQPQQKKLLLRSFTQYLVQENLDLQTILGSLASQEDKIPSNLKMWTNICSVLPNRTLKSCYKYLIRKLSGGNRLGKWTEQEEEQLVNLQGRLGNKWALIAKKLGRTPENIRDKFRCLHKKEQQTKFWKFEDLAHFVQQIEKQTKIKFINPKLETEFGNSEKHNQQQIKNREQMNVKYNSKMSIHHNNAVLLDCINTEVFNRISTHELKWKLISDTLESKTEIDCKNKYFELVKIINRDPEGKFGVKVISFLEAQNPQTEQQINWQKWKSKQHGIQKSQARNRWFLIRKKIDGRSEMSFTQILKEARKLVDKKRDTFLEKVRKQNEAIDKKVERAEKELLRKQNQKKNENEKNQANQEVVVVAVARKETQDKTNGKKKEKKISEEKPTKEKTDKTNKHPRKQKEIISNKILPSKTKNISKKNKKH